MSAEEGSPVQEFVSLVIDVTAEPSYLSEIARKLDNAIEDQSWSLDRVLQVASLLSDRDGIDFYDVGYGGNGGQEVGSMHYSSVPDGGREATKEWKEYTLIHNTDPNLSDMDESVREIIDPTMTVEEKVRIIDTLSGSGNDMSRAAEEIFQDAMERQFREYDVVEFGDYNDPGIDFQVIDNDRRGYGLAIEVSTRWENPVGTPYVDSKKEPAFDSDLDLIIIAPDFRDTLLEQYEKVDRGEWHADPEGEITHLHRVPTNRPAVYRPFAKEPSGEDFEPDGGFPVIVPDSERTRTRIGRIGHVGDSYPIIDDEFSEFRGAMESVDREFRAITESGYRAQVREAIEPLLHEFARPYKIEQYLIDSYWDEGRTTDEIGSLVGVSGRTIRDWLSDQHWDIVTRGTGTELSDDTVEIWRRMYEGEDPFPREMTGYEIQSMYNRHPLFGLGDWREWFNTDEDLRDELTRQRGGPLSEIGYTIMVGTDERLYPSYSFIINRLRREGVDIREGFIGDSGSVTPTGLALEYMINRRTGNLSNDSEPDGTGTVDMRSSLEVEMGEWLSENQIPYGYEPFVIPSTPAGGGGEGQGLSDFIKENATDETEVTWRRIYEKHDLGSQGDVGVDEGFELFETGEIVPDFVTYLDAGQVFRGRDWDGWSDWDHIIELAGLYGLGIQRGWSSWYRVRGVAYKELALKELGLWNKSYFLVPDDKSIPDDVRNDSHYIVLNPTQTDAGLDAMSQIPGLSVL
jgi:hypothetical protein